MKLRSALLASAVALFASASLSYADLVVNITGATAFRSAANNSIIAALGGAGVTQYAYSTSTGAAATGISGADRAIFKGTMAGLGNVTVRASWSGSTGGIASVVTATPVSLMKLDTPVSTTGINGGLTVAANFENAIAKFSFSDVAQAASNNPSPALNGTQVGVVPFMFVAQEGAPAGLTNMTDQLFAALYSTGATPLSTFTGNSADENLLVVPTGRANTSGTRVSILAETGYGFNTAVNQFMPTVVSGEVTALGSAGNGGFSSNSNVRAVLEAPMAASLASSRLVVSYLTISDAVAATTTGGAKALTYNGVAYSENNVKNGQYSLWSYQWFYNADGLTTDETTFRDAFVALIPDNLGTAGIPIPQMKVTRSGGDGGQVLSNL